MLSAKMPTFKMITIFIVFFAAFLIGHSTATWSFNSYQVSKESLVDLDDKGVLTDEDPDRRNVQHSKRSAEDKLFRLCGGHLYNMIRMVCVKHLSHKAKRSTGIYDFSLGTEYRNGGWSGTSSALERFLTSSMIGLRTKRGASTDCCLKPCTISHLVTFC